MTNAVHESEPLAKVFEIEDLATLEVLGSRSSTPRRSGPRFSAGFRSVASEYAPADSFVRLIASDRQTADLVTGLVLEGARVTASVISMGFARVVAATIGVRNVYAISGAITIAPV